MRGHGPRAGAPHWLFWAFAAIAAFFLLTEHYAHVVPYVPYLLVAACGLMHLFGHRHGGHGDDKDSG